MSLNPAKGFEVCPAQKPCALVTDVSKETARMGTRLKQDKWRIVLYGVNPRIKNLLTG